MQLSPSTLSASISIFTGCAVTWLHCEGQSYPTLRHYWPPSLNQLSWLWGSWECSLWPHSMPSWVYGSMAAWVYGSMDAHMYCKQCGNIRVGQWMQYAIWVYEWMLVWVWMHGMYGNAITWDIAVCVYELWLYHIGMTTYTLFRSTLAAVSHLPPHPIAHSDLVDLANQALQL